MEGVGDACSKLYSAARQAAKALGYERIITYLIVRMAQAFAQAGGITSGVSVVAVGLHQAGSGKTSTTVNKKLFESVVG